MTKSRKILASILAFVMIFSNTYNILPSLAINNVTDGIIQSPTTAVRPYKIMAVGDSITYGVHSNADGSSNNTPTEFAYPNQLKNLLNAYTTSVPKKTNIPSFEVVNYGAGGRALLKDSDYPYMNIGTYTNVLNAAPNADAVIIMLGTNDGRAVNWTPKNGRTPTENLIIDSKMMVDRLRLSNPNIRIIYATCLKGLDDREVGPQTSPMGVINDEIAPAQREAAILNGYELVDINRLTKDWTASTHAGDKIHPYDKDYHFIAEWMRDAVNDDGTKSSSFKVEAVKDFIAALPADTAITSENVSSNVTLYNRAKKTYDMLTATEKTSVGDITKLTAAKAKIQTLMGDTSLVTVSSTTAGAEVTSNATFANVDETVTLTASKVDSYRFKNWTVTNGTTKLDDYVSDTTTFTKQASPIAISAVYAPVAKQAPTAATFTASDRFVFPTDANFKEFEAEYMETNYGTNATADRVAVIDDRSSSNDKAVDNFKNGNKLKLYYNAAQTGEYTVGITYRSYINRPGDRTSALHAFNITGTNITSKFLTLQPTRFTTNGQNIVYYESFFTINVNTAGVGEIELTAESGITNPANSGPTIDKFNMRKLDSYVINAVGDSITHGCLTTFAGSYSPYPHTLQNLLNSKIASGEITDKANIIVANVGMPGTTIMSNGVAPYNTEAHSAPTYRCSIENKADATIIMLGTNDIGSSWGVTTPEQSYTTSAEALVTAYKASNSSMEIFFATSPKSTAIPRVLTVMAPLQRRLANKNHWNIIDIAEKTADLTNEYFDRDNIHPNDKGEQALARYMLDGIMNKVVGNEVMLSSLTSNTVLSPTFNENVLTYKTGTTKNNITLTATAKTATDTVAIIKDGTKIAEAVGTISGAVPLITGENLAKVTVTSGSDVKVYNVNITRWGDTIYISDLPWVNSVSGWNGTTVKRDYSPKEGTSEPIQINTAASGTAVASPIYKKGVGMHSGPSNAPGYLVVQIPEGMERFKSNIGISYPQLSSAAPMTFRVYWGTDGTTFDATAIYTSEMTRAGTNFAVIDIAVPSGKTYMKLELAAPSGNNVSSAHGNWADARFTTSLDKTALNDAIIAATALKSGAIEGTDVDNYITGSKAIYEVAINAAIGVKDTATTQDEITTAVTNLATATTIFNASKQTVALKTGDINGDNKFDLEDALIALKVAIGVIEQPTGNKFTNGNINKEAGSANIIDKEDANALLNHIINGTI